MTSLASTRTTTATPITKLIASTALGIIAALWGLGPACSPLSAADSDDWNAFTRPLLKSYCWQCHGHERQRGGLNLESVASAADLSAHAEVMGSLIKRLDDGDMPPITAPQPAAGERVQLIRWLRAHMPVESAAVDDPGTVIVPRLTPTQYERVIHDLTGVDIPIAAQLPRDGGAGEGFDNLGSAQTMSATHIRAYLAAASSVMGRARILPGISIDWLSTPQFEPQTTQELAAALIAQRDAWFLDHWAQKVHEHISSLGPLLHLADGKPHPQFEWLTVYLHAAWQYRFRAALGHAEWTPSAVAAAYAVPLRPEILARLVFALAQNPANANLYWRQIERWWDALPPPPPISAEDFRASCRAMLLTWLSRQNPGHSDGSQIEVAERRLGFEVDPATYMTQLYEPYSVMNLEGRRPFRFRIDRRHDLYLVTTDAATDGDTLQDHMIWEHGVIVRDGREESWTAAKVLDEAGRPVAWGSRPAGIVSDISPDAIEVRAPAVLHVVLPDGATAFSVQARADPLNARNGAMQAVPLDHPPSADERRFVTGHWIFGAPGAKRPLGMAASARAIQVKLDDQTPWMISFMGRGLGLPEDVKARWKVTPTPVLPDAAFGTEVGMTGEFSLWVGTEAMLDALANPQERAEISHMGDQLRALAEVRDDLMAFLALHGVKCATAAEAMTRAPPPLPPEQMRGYLSLKSAAQADEGRLADCARQQISAFAQRAWRGAPASDRITQLVGLYQRGRDEGLCYEASMKKALIGVLASPFFLYRVQESRHQASAYPLSGRELAERLSFVLWGSIPDQELLAAGGSGRLDDPAELHRQIERMVADPRAEALAGEFAAQAFLFASFDHFDGPDQKRFPQFTPSVRKAMYQECRSFFAYVFQQDRPLTEIVDADYCFLNEELAGFYGIHGVSCGDFRKVTVDPAKRGGVLGTGAFLARTSAPLRSSPIKRGNWILSQLLGTPPPPPPPAVAQISSDEHDDKGLTILEQMRIHRSDVRCASCHERIDPLGIALEAFDPIGRHRTALQDGQAVQDHVTTAGGCLLDGFAGLKRYLMLDRQRELVMRNLCVKFLGYAFGRSVAPADEPLVARVMDGLRAHGWHASALIHGVLESPQFRQRSDTNESPETKEKR